jgi:hypothetical protein
LPRVFSLLMRLHSLPLSPFACPASRCGASKREGSACSSLTWHLVRQERRFTRDIALSQEPRRRARRSHLWQGRQIHSALSSLRLVRHAPSQFVVGASRRSAAPGSQYWSAARDGSAGVACLLRPELRSTTLARVSQQARPVAFGSVMLNPSIERTRPGKPGRASHVKRWASRKE